MENIRKQLHYISLGLFLMIIFSIFNNASLILEMNNLDVATMTAEQLAAKPFAYGVVIAGALFHVIVLAFLGIKGIKEAKEPTNARFHIILAIIVCVFSGLSAVSMIVNLFNGAQFFKIICELLFALIVAVDTFLYAKYAKAIRAEA